MGPTRHCRAAGVTDSRNSSGCLAKGSCFGNLADALFILAGPSRAKRGDFYTALSGV